MGIPDSRDELSLAVQGSGFRVQDSGFRAQGSGFKIQGSGFRAVVDHLLAQLLQLPRG